VNLGVLPGPQRQFYLYDLGAAASPTLDDMADELAPYGPRLSLTDRSPVCSLRYSSLEAVEGQMLGPLADLQMAVHTLVVLAGGRLPWDGGAAGSLTREVASRERRHLRASPAAASDMLRCLPQPVAELGEWLYAHCNCWPAPDLQAAWWHDRLETAAASLDQRMGAPYVHADGAMSTPSVLVH
jgi:hypothetical protein